MIVACSIDVEAEVCHGPAHWLSQDRRHSSSAVGGSVRDAWEA